MEYRKLGTSDLDVSVVGLGCNNFGMLIDADASRRVLDAAFDAGINLLDTAEMYGGGKSEEFIGKALGSRRSDVLIATKFGKPDGAGIGTREYVTNAVEGSLRRLGTDVIDLYQMHYPDPQTPIEETLEALGRLVDAGKLRFVGCSNFSGAQIRAANAGARAIGAPALVSAQHQWSLLAREVEEEVIPACEEQGMGQLPYFPLASGLLTGKYERGRPHPEGTRLAASDYFASIASEENFAKVDRLKAFAAGRGHTILELAFSWLASQSCVGSVIAGATKPEQVEMNARAADWKLSAEDLAEVDSVLAWR